MRLLVLVLLLCGTALAAAAERSKTRRTRTVPAPYPAIIKLPRVAEAPDRPATGVLLYNTDLGGRELVFLQTAHETGQRQFALAQLATFRAHTEEIRAVAEALVETQTAENKEVTRLASLKGLSLARMLDPAVPKPVTSAAGPKFDKAWSDALFVVTERAVTAYENGAQSADVEIREFAEQMLPRTRAKLKIAARLAGRQLGSSP